jgi:hypothetical protein
MNSSRDLRTCDGKKEAVRLDHRKLIGSRLNMPFVRTFWRQELSSGQTRICTLDWRGFEY